MIHALAEVIKNSKSAALQLINIFMGQIINTYVKSITTKGRFSAQNE